MSKMIFKTVTPEFPDNDLVNAIYNEAFPERERTFSFEDFLQLVQDTDFVKINAAYESGKIIGIMIYFEFDEYIYLMFFAVNSELRGGGYGSRLIRSFVDEYPEKAFIGAIETPIPGTSNYNQRVKRKVFWERLDFIMTKYSLGADDEDMFTLTANRQDDSIIGYYISFFKLLQQMGNANGAFPTSSAPKKCYRTENGKLTEVPPSEWLIW